WRGNPLLIENKILPNFKISRFFHLKIQAYLNVYFIECEKVYSSFKDDQFYLQKKDSRLKHKYPVSYRVQLLVRNLLKFECIELENQINFFLNDGHISIMQNATLCSYFTTKNMSF
ncbi:hypothetical protein BpHYR1_053665, partial [Brachionus plicatilis]